MRVDSSTSSSSLNSTGGSSDQNLQDMLTQMELMSSILDQMEAAQQNAQQDPSTTQTSGAETGK